MKIAGKKIQRPPFEVIVIPRSNGDIIIKAGSVLDYTDFEKLCPSPKPPEVIRPGGENGIRSINVEDPKYKEAITIWASNRVNWMIMKSLQATEELEFETVKVDDSDTWKNIVPELKEAGFSDMEINMIVETVMIASGLSQGKIDQATKNFVTFPVAPGAEK